MAKVGRNVACPCGSGKKYKRCCGNPVTSGTSGIHLSPEHFRHIELARSRSEAQEYQRRLMQGLGRPIISIKMNGYRAVAVGNQIRYSTHWLTFHDFLLDYIKSTLSTEWGNAELAKPEAECHPLIRWYRKIGAYLQAPGHSKQGRIDTGQMNGVMQAFWGLAYDLYLSEHNAELSTLLLKRLRDPANFEGALYEAFVIGSFVKAGFQIELENESDSRSSHCEFVATHQETGRKFSVEAKAFTSASNRAGLSPAPPKVREKLYKALCKEAKFERIIFIELSRAQHLLPNGHPDWAPLVNQEVAALESELQIDGHPAPPAYVFVTNRAFLHTLDDIDCCTAVMARGFKIEDFHSGKRMSFLEMVQARDRHIELHWLLRAMQASHIPSTFDNRTPEEVFSEQPITFLHIGETYLTSDENGRPTPGILYEGTVMEGDRQAFCSYRLWDGRYVNSLVPLSDADLARYKSSPDTFFGVVKPVSRMAKTQLDIYDFFFEVYSESPREQLLNLMCGWPEADRLPTLSQRELAQIYSVRMAEGAIASGMLMQASNPPVNASPPKE